MPMPNKAVRRQIERLAAEFARQCPRLRFVESQNLWFMPHDGSWQMVLDVPETIDAIRLELELKPKSLGRWALATARRLPGLYAATPAELPQPGFIRLRRRGPATPTAPQEG